MLTLDDILIARDFSSVSERALRHALELAARTGARLHVLHAEVLHDLEERDRPAPTDGIDALRTELEVFEADVTRGGNLRYDAPSGFHDDTVDALALAADARTEAARQGAATTARMGETTDTGKGPIEDAVAEYQRQYRDAQRGWK